MHNSNILDKDLFEYVNEKINQRYLPNGVKDFWKWEFPQVALPRYAEKSLGRQTLIQPPISNYLFSAKQSFALVAIDPASYRSSNSQHSHDESEVECGVLNSHLSSSAQFYLIGFLEARESLAPDFPLAQLQIFALGNQESALNFLKELEIKQPGNSTFDRVRKKIEQLSCQSTCEKNAVLNHSAQAPKPEGYYVFEFLNALEFAALLLPDVASGAILAGIVHFTRSVVGFFVKEPKSPIFSVVEKVADLLPGDFKNLAKAINLLAKDSYPVQVEVNSGFLEKPESIRLLSYQFTLHLDKLLRPMPNQVMIHLEESTATSEQKSIPVLEEAQPSTKLFSKDISSALDEEPQTSIEESSDEQLLFPNEQPLFIEESSEDISTEREMEESKSPYVPQRVGKCWIEEPTYSYSSNYVRNNVTVRQGV